MRPINCIFCDIPLTPRGAEQPDSRTREHVYASWYRNNVVNQNIKLFTSDGTVATMHRQPNLNAFVNGSVCGSCNSRWMSQLETRVEPIFGKLTSGTDISQLSQEEVDTLARWTGKTAVVLGYVLTTPAIVASSIRKSFLPTHAKPPHMRLFYAFIEQADLTLEGGYLQLKYAAEVPVIGETGGSGFRFTLCVHNHCLTVDFPPILEAVRYDLSESRSAQIWPTYVPAGTTSSIPGPILIGEALRIICGQIKVAFDIAQMQV